MEPIKVSELAYCRFRVPDMDRAEDFLIDFGLLRVTEKSGIRYFRATDDHTWCYSIEEGPEHFLGWAFHAKSLADLERLAAIEEKSIEPIEAPAVGIGSGCRSRTDTTWTSCSDPRRSSRSKSRGSRTTPHRIRFVGKVNCTD